MLFYSDFIQEQVDGKGKAFPDVTVQATISNGHWWVRYGANWLIELQLGTAAIDWTEKKDYSVSLQVTMPAQLIDQNMLLLD